MAVNTEHSSVISKTAFKVTIGIFFGLAIASLIGRLGFRIHTRRRLYLDDYVVLIGAACLCVSTGLAYKNCEFLFVTDVIQRNPSLLSKANADQIQILSEIRFSALYVSLALSWTTIFAVKISFLIFFKKLINRVTKIHTYYWIVGFITLLSWLFMVFEPFVLCKDPNQTVAKCKFPSLQVSVAMSWLTNSLDIFTDVLIVSIPMIILRRAKIKNRQKVALSFFLCLSIVMIVIAIVRISRITHSGILDSVWQGFWQTLEPCIALLMSSITAFRTIFVSQEMRERDRKRWAGPSYSWIQRAKQRKANKEGDMWNYDHQLLSVPQATFVKLTSFMRHHATIGESTTLDPETGFSEEREGEEGASLIIRSKREEHHS